MPTKSHTPAPLLPSARPGDATLTVKKAARVLGVHPNTVRAWSEAGRLRFYRINDRGDRRYRLGDLQRFLAAAEAPAGAPGRRHPRRPARAPARRRSPRRRRASTSSPTSRRSPPSRPASTRRSTRRATGSGSRPARRSSAIWERRPSGLVPRASDVEPGVEPVDRSLSVGGGLYEAALESAEPIHARPGDLATPPQLGLGTDELIVRIPGGEAPWGVLVLAGAVQLGPDDGRRLATAIARTLGVIVRGAAASDQATGRLRRSEALRRVATDLASRLDMADVVRDLSDHARVLFGADRVAVILHDADGRVSSPGGSGFSDAFLATARDLELGRHAQGEIPPRRPVVIVGPDAPRSSSPIRAAAVQEGVDSLLVGAAGRRARAARRRLPRPRPPAPLARARPRRGRGARGRRGDRGALRADVRADGGLGGAAPVDPAPRRAAGGHLRGARDRDDDRHRAAAADHLRQRAGLPGRRRAAVAGRVPGPGHGLQQRDPGGARRRRRRGDHRLGRPVPRAAARRQHGERPPRGHDPRQRPRPRRVDAARADGPRRGVHRRRRPRPDGPPPVHRGRPAAARDLRLVRGPGDGQRGRRRPDARAGGRPRAPAARPARAAAGHRVDPDHARPARGAGADRRAARVAGPVRQHRDRGRRARHPAAAAAHRAGRPRGELPRSLGAGRDRPRDLGRGAQ